MIAVTIGILLLNGAAEVQAAIREIFVKPHETDPSITLADKPHYVVYDPQAVGVLLFVFFPGTGGTPGRSPLLNTAIEQGYRAISLSYPNIPAVAQVCVGSGDGLCAAYVPAFLRLVECDPPVPLRLTLQHEAGDEIASAMAPAAIQSAILLLARSESLRPGYRLVVSTPTTHIA